MFRAEELVISGSGGNTGLRAHVSVSGVYRDVSVTWLFPSRAYSARSSMSGFLSAIAIARVQTNALSPWGKVTPPFGVCLTFPQRLADRGLP